MSNSAAVDGFVQQCVELYDRIDILVNNAGVNLPGIFHEVSNDEIDRTLNINVKGYMYGSRAAIPYMLLSVYAASKGAIVMLTKGIALDYAKQGIRCNCICLGWVDTPINYAHAEMMGGLDKIYAEIDRFQPIGRPGEPSEIANLALFLASDEASFLTGSIIAADGGMTAQ